MITLIAPAEGGVAHVSESLARAWSVTGTLVRHIVVDDAGHVRGDTSVDTRPPTFQRLISSLGAPGLNAIVEAWRHRRDLRKSSSIHVEVGRTSTGPFWFALAATCLAPRRPLVLSAHDMPVVVRHPGAVLSPLGRGWRDVLAYRIVAPLLDGVALALFKSRTSATVVTSQAAADAARERSWPQVRWLRHGAEPPAPGSVPPNDGTYVLLAGFLGPGKGLDVLVEAWPMVASPLPLVIAGGHSPNDAEYVSRARQLLVEHAPSTQWLGYVSDDEFVNLIRGAAVVVLPYEVSNPASGVLVRALVEGRAVVATAVPAVTPEITDGVNGLVVPPADPTELARALRRALGDGDLRDRLGREAMRRAVGQHSWARYAKQLASLHRATGRDSTIIED